MHCKEIERVLVDAQKDIDAEAVRGEFTGVLKWLKELKEEHQNPVRVLNIIDELEGVIEATIQRTRR